jgi:clan AA aspartic protease (TIGR02281 family)
MKRHFFNFTFFILLSFNIKSVAQTVVYMEKDGGVYNVPCKVNGVPLKFIFDTGASNVLISLTEAAFMLKNNLLTDDDIIGTSRSQIADGSVTENTAIVLRVVEIGGIELYNVRASIIHNSKAPLLFGQSAIEKLGKIQLEGNKLTILNGGKVKYDFAEFYPIGDKKSSDAGYNLANCKKRPSQESYSGSEKFLLKNDSRMWENKEVGGALIAQFPSETKVKLISRVFDWWQVECNGKIGWIVERNINLPTCMLWLENISK